MSSKCAIHPSFYRLHQHDQEYVRSGAFGWGRKYKINVAELALDICLPYQLTACHGNSVNLSQGFVSNEYLI